MTASGDPGDAPGVASEASAEPRPEGGGHPSDALPLEALDRALAPVRRVASWASAAPDTRIDAVRYLEAIGRGWLARALALDLPGAVHEQLGEVAGLLEGFDRAVRDERVRRIVRVDTIVRRIDAQLGMPLAIRLPVRRPVVPLEALLQPEPEPEPTPRAERSGRRRRRSAAPAPAPEPEPEPIPEPEPSGWNGDLSVGLAELGLDPALVEALSNEDVTTVGQLLRLPPVGEEELTPLHGAGREIPAGRVAVGGRVGARTTVVAPSGARTRAVRLRGAGSLLCRFTVEPSWEEGTDDWLDAFASDKRVVVVGQLVEEEGEPVLLDPELAADDGRHTARLQQYGLDAVSDRAVRRLMGRLLEGAERIRDPLPGAVRGRLQLPALGEALADFHLHGKANPAARARLAFDEILLAQLALSCRRFQASRDRGIPHTILHGLASRLGGGEEFALDDEQQLAFEDIKRDLRQPTPMLRAIVGEVGAGKGTVALVTAVSVAESKSQVLVLSPDRATAEQRFAFAEPLLREAGLVARVVDEGAKRSIRDAIGRGEVHVVFGPIELLEEGVDFRRLGLVVAEERERWGRASEAIRKLRSPRPHALIIPATPVGAAVALTAYADHDLTVLGDAGRRPVSVEIFLATERAAAYERAADAVRSGRQVMVVFPMVRGQDALTLREAMRVVRALEEDALSGARVALYHGSMPREERHRVYDDFRHRRSDVLVSTTLVEDGPTVVDASLVVVEQADRVDRTRLQRIRGFISRARHEAGAVLVVGEMSDEGSAERLQSLLDATDGFALHDAFVETRPIEELVVEGAPPLPTFAWADLRADRQLVWRARDVAHELLRGDSALRRGWGVELAREARARFDDLWPAEEGEGSSWRCPIPDGPGGERRKRRRRRRKR